MRSLIHFTVHGYGTQGVIHVGFRRWIIGQALDLGLDCMAFNQGSTVEVVATGDPLMLRILVARARNGPPNSRVLAVTVTKQEEIIGIV